MRHTPMVEIAAKPLYTIQKKDSSSTYKSPSLKTLLEPEKKKTNEKGEVIEAIPTKRTAFTSDELVFAWNEYRSLIKKDSDKTSLYSAVSANLPILGDDFHITIEVFSPIQTAQIDEYKASILEYIKNKLQNDFLQLTAVLIKNKNEDSKMLYTDHDKFKVMKEKNEAIEYMRLKFNLDIEF